MCSKLVFSMWSASSIAILKYTRSATIETKPEPHMSRPEPVPYLSKNNIVLFFLMHLFRAQLLTHGPRARIRQSRLPRRLEEQAGSRGPRTVALTAGGRGECLGAPQVASGARGAPVLPPGGRVSKVVHYMRRKDALKNKTI